MSRVIDFGDELEVAPDLTSLTAKVKSVAGDLEALQVLALGTMSNFVQQASTQQQAHTTLVKDLTTRIAELEKVYVPRETTITINHNGTTKTHTGTFHKNFPTLVRLATSLAEFDRNIWITGPAGSGKTTAAHKLAAFLNLPFEFLGAIDTPYKLMGYMDAGGTYRGTSFRRIYENGGIILLDECDGSSPGALLEINAATANGWANFPDGMIRRHHDCYVLCAANTWGFGGDANYVSRPKLDAAFLDRFVTLSWPYDEDLERAASLDDEWTTVVQTVRRAANAASAQVVISPRASIKGGQLHAAGCSREEVVEAIFGRYRTHTAWQAFGKAAEQYAKTPEGQTLAEASVNIRLNGRNYFPAKYNGGRCNKCFEIFRVGQDIYSSDGFMYHKGCGE